MLIRGPLGRCPTGDQIFLSATVSQHGTTANGNWPAPHPCTGHDQRCALTAHTTSNGRLVSGPATGHATVVIKHNGYVIETVRWHRAITLRTSG